MITAAKKLLLTSQLRCDRNLWWWTVMMFNRMDQERTKTHGYDRTCAEWALRNGACVKFQGYAKVLCDYNILPPENTKFKVKEISADNAGLNAEGFNHIKGCEILDSIILKNCSYITDEALEKLVLRKDSLKHLEIEKCKNITEDGLKTLFVLQNLKKLILKDLPYVKDINVISDQLKTNLKNCEIILE